MCCSISKDDVYVTEHTGENNKKGRAQCCNVVKKRLLMALGSFAKNLKRNCFYFLYRVVKIWHGHDVLHLSKKSGKLSGNNMRCSN